MFADTHCIQPYCLDVCTQHDLLQQTSFSLQNHIQNISILLFHLHLKFQKASRLLVPESNLNTHIAVVIHASWKRLTKKIKTIIKFLKYLLNIFIKHHTLVDIWI